MKNLTFVFSTIFFLSVSIVISAQSICKSQLTNCDLLFVAPKESNAITSVTVGFSNLGIDHVAAVVMKKEREEKKEESLWTRKIGVIESVPKVGVREIDLDSFLMSHTDDVIIVGRLKEMFDVSKTLEHLQSHLGLPYDSLYLENNDAIYCSELVLRCYVDSMGQFIFAPIAMTFRNTEDVIPAYWNNLYMRHGMAVPEGKNGSNPGELSRREQVAIIGCLREKMKEKKGKWRE